MGRRVVSIEVLSHESGSGAAPMQLFEIGLDSIRESGEMLSLDKGWVIVYNARSNGLGNRLRVTLGALELARSRGRRLGVVWPTTELFRPRFGDLFMGKDWLSVPLLGSQALATVFPFRDEHLQDLDRIASRSSVWQIRTGAILELPDDVPSWEDGLRRLEPIPLIAESVSRLHGEFSGDPYLGVQIRANVVSHQKTLRASPVEWFTKRLDAIRMQNPDLRFYFSCDVAGIQQDMVERYPGSVALNEKGAYNSTAAVQAAVVDMYLLASSGYILGPAYSSFVELAVRLSGHAVPFENSLKDDASSFDALTTVVDPLRPSVRDNC